MNPSVWIFRVLLIVVCNWCVSGDNAQNATSPTSEERLYFMKRVGGAGCPYTASWLLHINLFRRVTWWIDITKMEAASFNVFDTAKLKFQLSDPDAYYVHHMSMYEHYLHQKQGFGVAQNKTLILSKAAFAGECTNLNVSKLRSAISFVPFYGGLPPNVTKDLAVKSIGQGNSLVDASTKALQTMATVCSCLKYFGNVVIGVTRDEDRILIEQMLHDVNPMIRHHVNLIQLKMNKPSHLPFHLLAWGQRFIQHYNCWPFYDDKARAIHNKESMGFTAYPVHLHLLPSNSTEYDICHPRAVAKYHGGPLRVTYVMKDLIPASRFSNRNTTLRHLLSSRKAKIPLRLAYYTECDQIVYFDGPDTFNMISAAVNETTFFNGRRKEKNGNSDPEQYMGGLTNWRECGQTGYLLRWPTSNLVYADKMA